MGRLYFVEVQVVGAAILASCASPSLLFLWSDLLHLLCEHCLVHMVLGINILRQQRVEDERPIKVRLFGLVWRNWIFCGVRLGNHFKLGHRHVGRGFYK